MQPLALHPDNPHYFWWRGKPTVLITSGEHYGAVLNLDVDYIAYLDTLAADGLNLTRTFVGTYREIPGSFGISDNVLAPHPNRYLAPWARSDTPGYFDAGNKFDLTTWDEAFFTRLKDFVTQASRRGIVVELNLFTPMYTDDLWKANPMHVANNINGIGHVPANEVFTTRHRDLLAVQEAVVRKLVTELHAFDNLYYEVCNEPYFGGVTTDWHDHIVATVVDAEKHFPAQHLISHNVANGRARVEHPHPAISILNFHYCHPPDTVAMNYHLNKVIGANETGFRGKDDVLYRTEGWHFILAGGGLYNNLDYSFTPQHPRGDMRDYQSPGGGSPTLRKQLSILKAFIHSFNFVKMAPDNAIIRGGASIHPGTRLRAVIARLTGRASARALVEPGKAYAIYLQGGTRVHLVLDVPASTYTAEWLNTKTGTIEHTVVINHTGGKLRLTSPAYTEDIALRLVAVQEE
jgi:hypothetical protein